MQLPGVRNRGAGRKGRHRRVCVREKGRQQGMRLEVQPPGGEAQGVRHRGWDQWDRSGVGWNAPVLRGAAAGAARQHAQTTLAARRALPCT